MLEELVAGAMKSLLSAAGDYISAKTVENNARKAEAYARVLDAMREIQRIDDDYEPVSVWVRDSAGTGEVSS